MLSCLLVLCACVQLTGANVFRVPPRDQVVAEGASLLWSCQADVQTPSYSWRFNDAFISVSTQQFVYENGSLYIGNVSEAHVGTYQCVVSTRSQVYYSQTAALALAYLAPVFSIHPSNQTSVAGDKIIFSCEIDSRPPALISWLHNGNQVTRGVVSIVTQTRSRLVLTSVGYSDSGTYQCEAVNPVSSRSQRSYIASLKLSGRPEFPSTLSPVIVPLGGTAILNCSAVGVPEPSMQWYRSSALILNNGRYTVYKNGVLRVSNSQKSDAGFYMCVARNKWGERSMSVRLIVTDPQDAPQITTVTERVVAFAGELVTLQCQATGNPAPTITWSKQLGSLPDGRTKFPFHGAMQISSVTPEDSGIYVCRAVNSAGQVTRQAQLDVQSAANITLTPKSVSVKEPESVVLHCQAYGNPAPVISWIIPNGVELKVSAEPQTVYAAEGITLYRNASLYIPAVQLRHHGIYTCSAANRVATTTASASVTVKVPPAFIRKPSNIRTFDGQTVLWDCTASGQPVPTIQWYPPNSDQQIYADSTFQVFGNGSLLIRAARRRLNGVYRCVASNALGSKTASATLEVIVSPQFTLLPQDGVAGIGDTVSFHCQASGDPTPNLFWQRDGQTIILDDNMQLYANHTLVIQGVRQDQYGQYTCTAVHSDLTISHTAHLYPPDVPRFLEEPRNITVNMSDTVTLKCAAKARQLPEFQWYKSESSGSLGSKVILGSRSNSEILLLPQGDLSIKNIQLHHEGWYACVAKTTSGAATSPPAYLHVQGLPVIISASAPDSVKAGSAAILTCQASSDLDLQLRWVSPLGIGIKTTTTDYTVTERSLEVKVTEVQRDWGQWTCRACNALGCVSKYIQLNVEGGAVLRNWDIQKKNTSSPIIIKCTAVGTPLPSVIYTVDEAIITSNTRLSFARLTPDGSLSVNQSETPFHIFQCAAENKYGTQKHTFQVPDKPHSVQASKVSSYSVQLAWQSANTKTVLQTSSYNLQYREDTDVVVPWEMLYGSDDSRTLVVTRLQPYTSYEFRVQGINILGGGPFSDEKSNVLTSAAAPDKPGNVSVVTENNTLTVYWSVPVRLNGHPGDIVYRVVYRKLNSVLLEEILVSNYQQTRFQINHLEFDIEYEITLQAVNRKTNQSSPSVVTMATVLEKAPHLAVQGLRGSVFDTNAITMVWQRPNQFKVSGYLVAYAVLRSSKFTVLRVEGSTINSYTISGLKERTSYLVKVAAYNRAGEGPYSDVIEVKTKHGVTGEQKASEETGLSTGAIIGIVAGCLAAVFLLFVVLYIICCQCHHTRGTGTSRELLTLFEDTDDSSLKRKRVGPGFVSVVSTKKFELGGLYDLPKAQRNFNKNKKDRTVPAESSQRKYNVEGKGKASRKSDRQQTVAPSVTLISQQPASPTRSLEECVAARIVQTDRELQEVLLQNDHLTRSPNLSAHRESSLRRPKQHTQPPVHTEDITVGDGILSQQGALVLSTTSIDRGQGRYLLPDISIDQAVDDLKKIGGGLSSSANNPLVRSAVDLQIIPPASFGSLPRSLRGEMPSGSLPRSNSAAALADFKKSSSLPRSMQDFQTQFPDSSAALRTAQIASKSRDHWVSEKTAADQGNGKNNV